MSTHPHVADLLRQLCDLDELDAQLPLPILLNIYRPRLAVPYEGLLAFASDYVSADGEDLAPLHGELLQRYPIWDQTTLENTELFRVESWGRVEIRDTADEMEEIEAADGIGAMLFQADEINFQPYEPVLLLLQLSWALSPRLRENRLRTLELELALQPVGVRLALDMAGLVGEPEPMA